MSIDAIRLRPEDNVAPVLRPVAAGEAVQVRCNGTLATVLAADPIPLCHKISTTPIGEGQPVVKYGQSIGQATAPMEAGRYVPVHNLRSARAHTS